LAKKVAVLVEIYRGIVVKVRVFGSSRKALMAMRKRRKEEGLLTREDLENSERDFVVETAIEVE